MHNVWYYRYGGESEQLTFDQAIEKLNRHRGPIAVDTETIALNGKKRVQEIGWDEEGTEVAVSLERDARTCIGIGVAISPREAFYFPLGRSGWKNVPKSDPYPLVRKLSDPNITKIFFNSMFDLDRIEESFDIDCSDNFEDVAIACQVQGLWNSLDQNANWILHKDHYIIDDVLPKGKTMLDVPFNTTAYKCMHDCMDTYALAVQMRLLDWVDAEGTFTWADNYDFRHFDVTPRIRDCYQIDKQMVPLLRKMTKRGVGVNPLKVNFWDRKLRQEIAYYDSYFKPLGINPQSNDQLGWYLANERGHYVGLTPTGKHLKVTDEFIETLEDVTAYMARARRRRQKLRSTYIKPFLGLDRAYSHLRQDLATGRLGSWAFNSQNFPAKMRSIFRPDSGAWTWMDLHQAEMRVWANQAQDDVMLNAFAEGRSPHDTTMAALYPGVSKKRPDGSTDSRYTDSKSYNFALLADASAAVLAKTTRRPIEVVQAYKDQLYELYWKSKQHQDYMRQRHQPIEYPDWVEDDWGRRCHIPDLSIHTDETHQQKCRLNYPFQATVAGHVKRLMLILDSAGYDIVFQVHDEIVVDGDENFPSYLEDVHPVIKMPFEVEHRPDGKHERVEWE